MKRVNHSGQQRDKAFRLSIQTGLNGFSFCTDLADAEETLLSALPVAYPVDDRNLQLITHFLDNEPALQDHCSEVTWYIDTPWYSLVPEPLFLPENTLPEMRRHFGDAITHHETGFEPLPTIGAVLVYAYPSGIARLFSERFGEKLSLHHVAADTLQKMGQQPDALSDTPHLEALIRESDLMVSVWEKGKPLFFNRFLRGTLTGCEGNEEPDAPRRDELSLLYYLLKVLELHRMDAATASLRIASTASLPLLQQYLPQSEQCRYRTLAPQIPASMAQPDPFIHLLNLSL